MVNNSARQLKKRKIPIEWPRPNRAFVLLSVVIILRIWQEKEAEQPPPFFPMIERNLVRTVPLRENRNIGIMAHIDAGTRLPLKGSCIIPDQLQVSVKFMRAQPPWTGWFKNQTRDYDHIGGERLVCGAIIASSRSLHNHLAMSMDHRVERSLRVLLMCIRSVGGAQSETETDGVRPTNMVFQGIAFVNKMDRLGG